MRCAWLGPRRHQGPKPGTIQKQRRDCDHQWCERRSGTCQPPKSKSCDKSQHSMECGDLSPLWPLDPAKSRGQADGTMLRTATVPLLLCVASVLGQAPRARGDENPFGLPAPHDKSRPGSVMMHEGGKSFYDEIRLEFVRLAGGNDARILLMPSDSYSFGK